jgi:uncharacterized membrane protein YjjP (DUF1212 family)
VDYRLLLDTAILAGEIMLKSGAETYRIEDTMRRMLATSGADHVEAVVMSTSIIATIADPAMDPITLSCSVNDRDTNLNKIYLVNNISRNLCSGSIDLKAAYDELKEISHKVQFSQGLIAICTIVIAGAYPILLGGHYRDSFVGLFAGIFLALIKYIGDKINIHPFVTSAVGSLVVTVVPVLINRIFDQMFSQDLIITGSIMALLPGVAITNAVRDTLQGDFVSGGARSLEAIVKALAIVLGVGAGLVICGAHLGG